MNFNPGRSVMGISGLVVEYIGAIDVTRVRFPADAFNIWFPLGNMMVWAESGRCKPKAANRYLFGCALVHDNHA